MYDLVMRRRLAGVDAAAQDPHRIATEAQTYESTAKLEQAMSCWIDLAVTALARAELLRTESLRRAANSQPE